MAFKLGVNLVSDVLLSPLVEALEQQFPGVQIEAVPPPRRQPETPHAEYLESRRRWLAEMDLVLLPHFSLPATSELRDLSAVPLPELDPAAAGLFAELSQVEGRRYALPFVIQPALLYFNPAFLEQNGAAMPPVDWTLADFERTLQALRDAGEPPIPMMGLHDGLFDVTIQSSGGRFYDLEQAAWQLDSPESRQALARLARMVQSGLLVPNHPAGQAGFTADKSAFTYVANWGTLPPQLTYQPFPRGPQGRMVPYIAHVGVIPASSRHPDLAVRMLTALVANPEVRLTLARRGVRPLVPHPEVMAVWRDALGERGTEAVELSLAAIRTAWPDSYLVGEAAEVLAPYFRGEAELEELLPQLPGLERFRRSE